MKFSVEEFESYVNNTYDAPKATHTHTQQVSHYGIRPTLWADADGLLRTQPAIRARTPTQQGVPRHRGRWAREHTPKWKVPTGVPVHKGRSSQTSGQPVSHGAAVCAAPALSRSSSYGSSTSSAASTPTSSVATLPTQADLMAKDIRSNAYYAALYEGPPRLQKLYSRAHEVDPLGAMVQAAVERAMARRGGRAPERALW